MFQSLTFTRKYILALSLIALLSFLAYFNLNNIINKQSNDGEIINISGKQRMLSQQIAFFAIKDDSKELNRKVDLLEFGHDFLMTVPMSIELKNIYFEKPTNLDKRVREYIKHSKLVHKEKSMYSLMYVLESSQLLLKDLDTAVSIYQKESEKKVSRLKDIEFLILIFTIIVLIFEAIFIFDPASKKIDNKTQELIDEINFSDTVTESNTNAIISVGSDFKVRTFNKSAQEIFGYTKEEMIGSNSLFKIVPDMYKNAHNLGLSQFFRTGRFKFESKVLELTAKRKNGEHFPIRISFGSNQNENYRIVVANIQDITDELEKDSKILEQSRYAAMGEMIGNIAHQWRQPLSSISTISSGAKIRKKANMIDDDELIDAFDKITDQTKYLSKTIDDFRNYFTKNENRSDFEVEKVINHAISLTEVVYKNNDIEIIVNNNSNSILCNGSEGELSQVFMNLLNNSKDILVDSNIDNKIVLIEIEKNESSIVINYYDNGNGINEDIITKIFEPYFTTKHKSKGTGIGLFMSKEIISNHFNGSIVASNKEFSQNSNKYFGACFTITIPCVQN